MLEDEPEKIPDTAALLVELREVLDTARSMPLSASVMVNREEFGQILQDAIDGLPEELRQARWLLKERDEVIERAEHEAARIIDVARVRAERMVERTEVVREARRAAEDTIQQAGVLAAQMRLEAEDYVDRKLASFEVILDRTQQQVAKGRERLSVHAPAHEDLLGPEAEEAEQAFFDQDDGSS
jgi:cell division septum initiation protein DivIVA